MSDFERSGDRAGVTYDEPARRRTPGTFFADLGDRLARGFNSFDRPQPDEGEWEDYEELDQPTQAVDSIPPSEPSPRRFQTVLHGYDRDAVDDYIDGLEHEIGQMAAKLSAQRSAPPPPPAPSVEDEIARVGQETSAILRVAHEQAAEITRRARVEAERCVADAASNAVAMTDDAKRKLRQLDSETDAVWTERIRLIEDVRNVATSLFSLAEDACDRFPEDADRGGSAGPAIASPAKPTESEAPRAPERKTQPGPMGPATAAGSAHAGPASPPSTPQGPVPHAAPAPAPAPVAAQPTARSPESPAGRVAGPVARLGAAGLEQLRAELGLRVQARRQPPAERGASKLAAERGCVLEQVVAGEDHESADVPHREAVRAPGQLSHPAVAHIDRSRIQPGQGTLDVGRGPLRERREAAGVDHASVVVERRVIEPEGVGSVAG